MTFEHVLFDYGNPFSRILMRRNVAEKCAQGYVGKELLLLGQLVRVISVRLQDEPLSSGERGQVIATCEIVSGLEQVQPKPYVPGMEYK